MRLPLATRRAAEAGATIAYVNMVGAQDELVYDGDSLIMVGEWDTADGSVRVIDFMPPRGEAADVVRIVEGVSGRVPMRMLLRLRFDYGSVTPWVRREEDHLVAVAGPDAVWLRTPVT